MGPDATLIITRKDERDVKFREAIILMDGEEIANLAYGESRELMIQPGKHTLQAYNRVFRSATLPFEVADRGQVSFSTGNIPNGCFGFLMLLQIAPPSIFLEPVGGTKSAG